jgi:hypothetical protein
LELHELHGPFPNDVHDGDDDDDDDWHSGYTVARGAGTVVPTVFIYIPVVEINQ